MNGTWADEELGFLQDHADWSAQRIAESLGRSRSSVENKIFALRRGWTRQREPWTADEDDLLLELGAGATAKQLASKLPGRSARSIEERRRSLGVGVHPKPSELSVWTVGARPLLAKTCSFCGKLLQADWFSFNNSQRRWKAQCRKCLVEMAANGRQRAGGRRVTDADRAYLEKMRRLTEPRAERSGQEYTEADHKILADPDLTVLQKALKLRRTYHAATSACRKSGYKSHVGLGEPEDLWRIFNPNDPAQVAS